MKKKISIILFMALIISLVPSNAVLAARKVSLSKKSLSLVVGKSKNLKLKNASKGKVKWSSSNKKVATVNKVGKVKAKKKGKTVILAKYLGKKYKCKVTVKSKSKTADPSSVPETKEQDPTPKPGASTDLPSAEPTVQPTVPAKGVLKVPSSKIEITESVTLSLSGATAESWRSSDEDIASVFGGVVIPFATGSVQIYCKDTNGYEYSCNISIVCPDITLRADSIYSKKIGNNTFYGLDFIVTNRSGYDIKFGGKDSMTNEDAVVTYFYQHGFDQDLTAVFALTPTSPFDTANMNKTIVCQKGYETTIYAFEGKTKYLPSTNSHFLWTVTINGEKYIMLTDFYGDILAMVWQGQSDI